MLSTTACGDAQRGTGTSARPASLYDLAGILVTVAVLCSLGYADPPDVVRHSGIFAKDNLVAWCIVPFDGKKRGPTERAEMLKRLGVKRVAYDWRENHVPTFEDEILAYKKHGLEYFAFWGSHPEAFRLFEKHDLHPQIWQTLGSPAGETQQARVETAARQMLALVLLTKQMDCKLGLYNHGGWGGEPENLVAVCAHLRTHHGANHVGIVYNQHHAHSRIDDFAQVIQQVKPYLLCLNLNGMTRNGDRIGKKILPLGEGEYDVALLKVICDSGYKGPIGIIGHTQDDVEQRLQDNLDGLQWILPQLDGRPAGQKPTLRTWFPDGAATSSIFPGVLVDGQAEFRHPPLTVECLVRLPQQTNYNILVASDAKASGSHWELFTEAGNGALTVYIPGSKPDHIRSNVMICDNRKHYISMLYESHRVRLYVDRRLVVDEEVAHTGQESLPGKLGIGRLAEGILGCSGSIDWVRISKGMRPVLARPDMTVSEDTQTVLFWQKEKDAKASPASSFNQKTVPYSPEVVSQYVESALEHGSVDRGVMVFSSAKSACLSCHKIGEHGGDVGPALTEIAKQRKPAEIIESVIWPQRHVQPEFSAVAVLTDEGQSYSGYAVHRNKQRLILRDPTKPKSENIVVQTDEIEAERTVGTLMPDNLIASLSDSQLDDLFRFLLSLGSGDGIPVDQLDSLLSHASAHAHGPVAFPVERKPLRPEYFPSWEHFVNRDRIYDYYAKQARYFRDEAHVPPLLTGFPGLDGGQQGHWGNQNDDTWASPRWNDAVLGSVQCGIFRANEGKIMVARGVCVQLGSDGQMATCFNPQTLTYDAVWSGRFLGFSSFRHGFLDGVRAAGPLLARPVGTQPNQDFEYHGFYRIGRRVIFAYRIGDTEYLDSPWIKDGGFARVVTPASNHPLRDQIGNAPAMWPQQFETEIIHGDESPYAIDTIGLPYDNPWKTQVFVGGLSFLPDGSALVCTMHGDVWHVSNLAYPSRVARWKRFAAGLHHPLGMIVDNDGVFVLGRDQITRLHDSNNDLEADFYECFSNVYQTSPAGHDFICGLQRDRSGRFYIASGNQGIVRISRDGKQAQVIATGFRNPDGLSLLLDGTVTVPCSEGDWTPASMICAVRPSNEVSFHGAGGPRSGQAPELPLAYLPRGLDNSAGGQTLVTSDMWGPLKGQLVHFSFGTGSHMLVLIDEVDGQLQGAVVPLPGEFRSGVHRGRFSPVDGQLYVGGMQGWGTYTPDDGCFHRVRYAGDDVQLPIKHVVYGNGILLHFSAMLDERVAENAKNHFAQCWNYRYSGAYGSPELSTKHLGMRGHDTLTITSAHVLEDGSLFLEIPDLQPVNQLHLLVKSNAETDHELFCTIHKLREPYRDFPGYRETRKTLNSHPMITDLAMVTRSVPNPHRAVIKDARDVTIQTGTNLTYATRSFRVRPGEPIKFTLSNPDVVPHNWALVRPGTLQRVGQLANKLISDPEAAVRHYIPDTSDVIAYTNVVLPQEEFSIYFRAPDQPGRYPYLCTFPGHWLIMNGEMIVSDGVVSE